MSSPPDLYDSHCHLDDPELAPELGEAFALAREKGLCGAVIPGYGPERWERQTELLRGDFDFRMLGGFGIHPWAVDGSLTIAELEAMLEQGWQQYARGWEKRLVAVGE